VRYYVLNPACYAEINNSFCQLYQIKTFYHRLVVISQKRSAVQTRQGYGENKHHEALFSGHVATSGVHERIIRPMQSRLCWIGTGISWETG
jgi:hypothetical protein